MSSSGKGELIQTKASLLRQQTSTVQEVVFTDTRSKPKDAPTESSKFKRRKPDASQSDEEKQRTFMKKARYEVIKFAIGGFDAAKKEENKQALAISLGAQPKKKKGINYKELKEMRKKQQEEDAKEKAFQGIGKTATGHAAAKIKNRVRLNKEKPKGDHKGGLLNVYGKVRKDQLDMKKR